VGSGFPCTPTLLLARAQLNPPELREELQLLDKVQGVFQSFAVLYAGYSVDTSQDHEYTNWEQVEKFTDDFVINLKNSNIPT